MKQRPQFVVTLLRSLVVAFLISPLWGLAQPDVQRSHIEANLPASEVFENYLRRDLLAYFNSKDHRTFTTVEFLLLRDTPTQSGTSYPKFYLWGKAYSGATMQAEGAVRVAAVERTRFEVIHFLSKESILANPEEVMNVFPEALVSKVHQLAGVPSR